MTAAQYHAPRRPIDRLVNAIKQVAGFKQRRKTGYAARHRRYREKHYGGTNSD